MQGPSIRIGITIGLTAEAETLWNNGIKQNAVFLAETLKGCHGVADVCLVNLGSTPITPTLPWDTERWPTVSFDESKDRLDVMVELGCQVSAEQTEYLKARGTRLVSYCCGSEYVLAMESMLFGRPSFGFNLFVNQRYDAVWMIPQVARTSEPYFSTLRRRPAQVVPFVWDPIFIRQKTASHGTMGEYRPRSGPRRISIMEPNVNVVKFCLYPIFIVEEAFRLRPDLISFLHVTNAQKLATDSKEFIALMNQLDIVRGHKAAFVGRFETPQFLTEMTDVVVSHQWENPLNYLYLEVCWQGYPLVHNAELCPELGYYYPDNDVAAGSRQLLGALEGHDDHWRDYIEIQRLAIERFLPHNAKVRATYSELLASVMQQPLT
jgi:hypothetical protein